MPISDKASLIRQDQLLGSPSNKNSMSKKVKDNHDDAQIKIDNHQVPFE